MLSKNKNSFGRLLSYEIKKLYGVFIFLTTICIFYSMYKVIELTTINKDFKSIIASSLKEDEYLAIYQNHLYDIFTGLNENFNLLVMLIAVIIIGICIYGIIGEFALKNKSGYLMLTLPVKRWKILLSRMIPPLLFFIINYFIGILMSGFGFMGLSNTLTGKYKEYFINNFIDSMNFFYIDKFVRTTGFIFIVISLAFMLVIMLKSYGKVLTIIIGTFIFAVIYIFWSVFMYANIFSFIVVMLILIIINTASFKMFETKIEI